jgi:acyl carrier protein
MYRIMVVPSSPKVQVASMPIDENGAAASDITDPRIEQILAIVAKEASMDVSRLRLDARIEEIGLQSLDVVQAIFELENHFNIEIPVVADRAGAEFVTLGDLVAHILVTLDKADANLTKGMAKAAPAKVTPE